MQTLTINANRLFYGFSFLIFISHFFNDKPCFRMLIFTSGFILKLDTAYQNHALG